MKALSLRRFLFSTLAVAALALAPITSTQAADKAGAKLGLQTWTCRDMSFEQVVEFAVKHDIKNLQMIGKHMDPNGTKEDWAKKKAVLDSKGLTCYTFGVAGTSMKKEENRKLFEMAKFLGCKLIIVEPRDQAIWDNLEELVKEYDIKLAIHNHGKGSVYGDPATVQKILDARDKRIGVCMDVGWITAAGFDAAEVFKNYKGRVYDMHLKDKKIEKTQDGKEVYLDVEVGTGNANYKGLFAEMKKEKWDGVMSIETDNATFAKEPTKFVEVAVKFFKENVK
ncbi:MAG: iolE 2 [Verrucomicrobia bacterium]|jgi:sugar phosphate isomerase/epimerase|nr:iolE 2 [Verrucomicrobiota bacterium]